MALPQHARLAVKSSPLNDDLAHAIYASLLDKPASDLAISLFTTLLDRLLLEMEWRQPRTKQREAFGALVADLLHRDPADHGGWLYRSLRPAGFTQDTVGYRVFRFLFEAMQPHMVEAMPRQRKSKTEFTGGEASQANSQATRFRASSWLRRGFEDEGINQSHWSEHFQRDTKAV